MAKFVNIFIFLSLCLSSLQARIIDVMTIDEVRNFIDPETLLIFDIDNTLVEPVQTLGSDQWFYHQKDQYIKEGMDPKDALEKALSEWMSIQNVTKVKIVEEGSEVLVNQLQDEGFSVMGMTTRGLGLSTRTIMQLKSLGIDFFRSGPTHEEVFFQNSHGVLFRSGILFTAGTNKGMALAKFLHLIDKKPENIVFINDKWQNLHEVEVIAEKYQVPFTGLRYSYLDEKVASFDPEIAAIQFAAFGYIMSDHEAKSRLEKKCDHITQE